MIHCQINQPKVREVFLTTEYHRVTSGRHSLDHIATPPQSMQPCAFALLLTPNQSLCYWYLLIQVFSFCVDDRMFLLGKGCFVYS